MRRDLLDHVIVLDERHLQRLLSALIACYHDDRTHLGLAKGTPSGRQASPKPIGNSEVVALPRIGGLHHRYECPRARSYPPRVLEGLTSGSAPETIRALARRRAASVLSFRGADGFLARDRLLARLTTVLSGRRNR